jgi:hypothetical protein
MVVFPLPCSDAGRGTEFQDLVKRAKAVEGGRLEAA